MINFKQFLTENKLEFKDAWEAFNYALNKKIRVPEVEEYLLKSKDMEWCFHYANDVINGTWLEYEKLLLKFKKPSYCYYYAKDIMKSRWPEAEEIICTNYSWSLEYCSYINKSIKNFQEELIQKNDFNITKIDKLHPDLQKKYSHLLLNKDIGII